MKKNLIIIILAIIAVMSVLYAFIKADEAEKERMAAEVVRQEALNEKEHADALEELAEQRAAEAIEAVSVANDYMEQLEKCQSK